MKTDWQEQIHADLTAGALPVVHLSLQEARGEALSLERSLTSVEQSRAKRFRSERDRTAFMAGRWLARTVLQPFAAEKTPLQFDLTPAGKPFCDQPGVPSFNLSHANGMVVLALSSVGSVGVDVEDEHRPLRSVEALACRYFAREEQEMVQSNRQEFLRIWTRREARVKAEGSGISKGFSHLNTLEEERTGTWCYTEWTFAGSHRGAVVHPPPSQTVSLYELIPRHQRLQRL